MSIFGGSHESLSTYLMPFISSWCSRRLISCFLTSIYCIKSFISSHSFFGSLTDLAIISICFSLKIRLEFDFKVFCGVIFGEGYSSDSESSISSSSSPSMMLPFVSLTYVLPGVSSFSAGSSSSPWLSSWGLSTVIFPSSISLWT